MSVLRPCSLMGQFPKQAAARGERGHTAVTVTHRYTFIEMDREKTRHEAGLKRKTG